MANAPDNLHRRLLWRTKQLPRTLSRRARFRHTGKYSSLYQPRSTWRKTQEKSKVQFPISIPSCLQGYVSTSLCNELLTVSPIKGTLRKLWDFTKSPWQQQETSPKHTLPQAVVKDVTTFLSNYVEENAVLLPGRIPGYKSDNIKLLSSSETKMNVWRAFQTACQTANKQAVSYSKFIELWEQFHPDVVVAKPMTDLCFTCQQNTSKLLRSANLPESEKSACVQSQQEHLNCVQTERELYRDVCKEAKSTFEAVENTIDLNESNDACSLNGTMHYSFDFAQQIHIPSNRMQPGPIYLRLHENVASSVLCVRQFLNKLTT